MTTTNADAPPKRKKARQRQLETEEGPIGDTIPVEVQDAADNYATALKSKNKAAAKLTAVKEDLLSVMESHDISSVKVQTDKGEKVIDRLNEPKLKMRKPKEGYSVAETDEDDDE